MENKKPRKASLKPIGAKPEPWRSNPRGVVMHNQVRADELYRENAIRERDCILSLADKLARLELLTESEAPYVARVLRHVAEQMPMAAANKRGHQPELDKIALAYSFAHKVVTLGMSEAAARDELATVAGVSLKAIDDGLKDLGDEMCRLYREAGSTKEAFDKAHGAERAKS